METFTCGLPLLPLALRVSGLLTSLYIAAPSQLSSPQRPPDAGLAIAARSRTTTSSRVPRSEKPKPQNPKPQGPQTQKAKGESVSVRVRASPLVNGVLVWLIRFLFYLFVEGQCPSRTVGRRHLRALHAGIWCCGCLYLFYWAAVSAELLTPA